MTISVGDIIRITLRFAVNVGDVYVNVYLGRVATAAAGGSPDALMDEILSFFDTLWQPLAGVIPPDISGLQVKGKNLTQNLLLPSRVWTTFTGSAAQAGYVSQASPFIWFPTDVPRVQKRIYMPPISEGVIAQQAIIDAPTLALLATYGAGISAGLSQAGWAVDWGVYNVPLDRFVDATAILVAPRLRTQRRRRVSVGS